jgi:hypothetical protein
MNCGKYELAIVAGLRIAANLAVNHELLPCLALVKGPVESLNPSLGPVCRHNTIGITGVHKNSVLSTQLRIYINGSRAVLGIKEASLLLAEIPLGHV